MIADAWTRPQWQDSGDEALLLWFVFGDFEPAFAIDATRYRTRGTPAGVEVVRYRNRELEKWDGYPLAGTLGRVLYDENSALFEQAKRSGECIMLRGALADPRDLGGLRDLIGTIAALTDVGGIAVVDPQTLSMLAAAEWRRMFFARDAFAARDHVLILADADESNAGRMHVHTRGMRKFARPDISIRNVPPARADAAGELAAGFIDFEAAGGVVEDGRRVEIADTASAMHARLVGTLDDPDFNNRHLALAWPD